MVVIVVLILIVNLQIQMGPRSSKDSTSNFMKDYEVIHRNTADNLTFLSHNKSHQEFLLREFNFNDKKESDKTMDKLAELKVKLGGNKHVVPLKDYLLSSEDQYCSTFYKIYALFQYPQRTLDDQINERNLQKRKFSETELWSILASCILGLSHLQKNGYKHSALKSSSILLSQEGIIKISDPFANGASPNYDTAITKRSTPHLYLSPEQSAALQQQTITPNVNHYKSDIWTMGMILLEAGLLEYQDDCYRDEWSRIQWETLQYNINRFGQSYSEQLKNMLEFMLSRDERVRPDWVDLQEHVMKGGDEGKRSFIQEDRSTLNNNEVSGNKLQAGRPEPSFVAPSPPAPRYSNQIQDNLSSSPGTGRNIEPRGPSIHLRSNGPFNPAPFVPFKAESPRAKSNTFQPYHPPITHQYPISQQPTQFMQVIHQHPHLNKVPSSNNGAKGVNIIASKPSNIEGTRPIRNIFPADFYKTQTTIDENLIMVEDQEDTQSHGAHDLQASERASYNPVNFNQPFSLIEHENNHNVHIVQSKITQGISGYSPQQHSPANYSESYRPSDPSYGNWEASRTNTQPQAPKAYSNTQQSQMKYVEEVFKMGSRYEGYKLNGMRHGPGKFYYQDGGMYDGEWRQNKMEGQGKLYYQSGKLAYDGSWKSDQFSGRGILYNEVPDILESSFNYENFDDVDEYWTKYEGQFSEDMKNGRGTLYLYNGEKFQGQFVADIVEGLGVFYSLNGRQIRGRWAGNQKIA